MRIIGGKWRGRQLAKVQRKYSSRSLRPTVDRIREGVFNILEHGDFRSLKGANVLDLFSGTGALGFEALSRGARKVCFVESNPYASSIIKKNKLILSLDYEVQLLETDATNLAPNDRQKFDLIFLDPPYGEGLGELSIRSAVKGGWIASGATIVWEENTKIFPSENVLFLQKRLYGKIVVSFLKLI